MYNSDENKKVLAVKNERLVIKDIVWHTAFNLWEQLNLLLTVEGSIKQNQTNLYHCIGVTWDQKRSYSKIAQKEQRSSQDGETVISENCYSAWPRARNGTQSQAAIFLAMRFRPRGGFQLSDHQKRWVTSFFNWIVRHSHEASTGMNHLGFVENAPRHLTDI